MKKDEWRKVQEMTLPELQARLRELRQELFNLRLQKATAQLEKPSRLRLLRRDIARLETRVTQLRRQASMQAS
ncbi:50S ribosomal protein L29 [Limisphaera sp. 4302-co]|uniref:50S ribosomal protein L29 n=1 Tax=Limisphaera sp. 4302-co TaxID=3400417 RepID=UPI003C1BA4DA